MNEFEAENNRGVRPLFWLVAVGFIIMTVLVGLGFRVVETADTAIPKQPPATVIVAEANLAQGRQVGDVIDPTQEPAQVLVSNRPRFELLRGDEKWRLNPRATFIIAGRIVSSQDYYDSEAALMPLDLIIAWGELSDPAVDQWISWSQSSRVGNFNLSAGIPFSKQYVNDHAANVHIIPASENLELAIRALEPNDKALMAGLLVDIRTDRIGIDTSLTRTDTGAGACEIYYVERLVVNGIEYR